MANGLSTYAVSTTFGLLGFAAGASLPVATTEQSVPPVSVTFAETVAPPVVVTASVYEPAASEIYGVTVPYRKFLRTAPPFTETVTGPVGRAVDDPDHRHGFAVLVECGRSDGASEGGLRRRDQGQSGEGRCEKAHVEDSPRAW